MTVGIGTRVLSEGGREGPCIVYVGRNPGWNEDQQGQCFVGRSGQLLQRMYIGGIQATEWAAVYLTNYVRCHTVNDAPPPAKAYNECGTYLVEDLGNILRRHEGRRAVVLLGGDVVKHFHQRVLGIKGATMKELFGVMPRVVPESKLWPEFLVFGMYHPAYVLRDPSHGVTVHDHNQKLLDVMMGNDPVPTPPQMAKPGPPPKRV